MAQQADLYGFGSTVPVRRGSRPQMRSTPRTCCTCQCMMRMTHQESASPTSHPASRPEVSWRRWQHGSGKKQGLPGRQTVKKTTSPRHPHHLQRTVQEEWPGGWCTSLPHVGEGDVCLVSPDPVFMIPAGEEEDIPPCFPVGEEWNLCTFQGLHHTLLAGAEGSGCGGNKKGWKAQEEVRGKHG